MKKFIYIFLSIILLFLTSCSNAEQAFFKENNIILYSYKENNPFLCKRGFNNVINDVSEIVYGEYTVISIDCSLESIYNDLDKSISDLYNILNNENHTVIIYFGNLQKIDIELFKPFKLKKGNNNLFFSNKEIHFFLSTIKVEPEDKFTNDLLVAIENGINYYKCCL